MEEETESSAPPGDDHSRARVIGDWVDAHVSAEFALGLLVAATTGIVGRQLADLGLAGSWVSVYLLAAVSTVTVALVRRRRWGKKRMLAVAGVMPAVDFARAHALSLGARVSARLIHAGVNPLNPQSWAGAVASSVVASTVAVAGVTAAEVAAGHNPSFFSKGTKTSELVIGAPFTVSTSPDSYDIALDAAGTSHLVWIDHSGVARYCRLPDGARSCQSERVLKTPPPGGIFGGADVVNILALGDEKIVALVGAGSLYAFTSRDGGRSFERPRRVSDLEPGAATVGPERRISLLAYGNYVHYQAVSLTGMTQKEAEIAGFAVGFNPSLAIDGGGAPIVTFDNHGKIFFRRWTRRGDINDAASWTPAAVAAPGAVGRLASGPAGVYLLQDGPSGQLLVRPFDGSGFGSAVKVSGSGDSATFEDIAEDSEGRLYVAWVVTHGSLCLRVRSNGVWGPTHVVSPGRYANVESYHDVRVRAGIGGRGVVTWISYEGELGAAPFMWR